MPDDDPAKRWPARRHRTADVDTGAISGDEANSIQVNSILADLSAEFPDLTDTLGGEQPLQSLGTLYRGFAIALLAIPLRSYTKPSIIMAVIPFAFIGVIPGHWIRGAALSAISFRSVLGLSGVIVNDSPGMINFIDQKLRDAIPVRTAIIEGAKGRFRPIMLISVTMSLGFAPLLLERPFRRSS